jgi:RNA 2',3'-cyclic 3'-phosphodiesterase
MRLFTGLDVPYETRRNLELLLQLLRPKADIQWSPLANLHVTTKFIGEWPEPRLGEMKTALAEVPRSGDITVNIRGLGWFPNPHQPRVFFVGVDGGKALHDLAQETDAACEELGVAGETKEYRPHLTLARIRRPVPLLDLQRVIAALPSAEFGAFAAREFHLYKSDLRPGGSQYTKLASFPLTA